MARGLRKAERGAKRVGREDGSQEHGITLDGLDCNDLLDGRTTFVEVVSWGQMFFNPRMPSMTS